jgi:hypothetical protein
MLTVRPLKERLVFYMHYSPLATTLDRLAAHVQEDTDTVRGWLANIDEQIKQLCQSERIAPQVNGRC